MKKIVTEAKGYGVVQRDFMTMKLSVFAKCVYTLLRTYSGDKQSCYPSLKTICNDLQISKSTVIRAIKDLESLNLVAVKRSKKQGSNENTVNTYIPLSVMVEIDLDKLVSDAQNQDLGGTPQTPRGTPQTPGVVSDVDSKNNSIKNNIEEVLNINAETSSASFQEELFPQEKVITSPKKKSPAPPKKVSHPAHVMIRNFWFDEFKPGSVWSNSYGKFINNIIANVEAQFSKQNVSPSPDQVLEYFKVACMESRKLPGNYFPLFGLNNFSSPSEFEKLIEMIEKNGQINKPTYQSQAQRTSDAINFFANL